MARRAGTSRRRCRRTRTGRSLTGRHLLPGSCPGGVGNWRRQAARLITQQPSPARGGEKGRHGSRERCSDLDVGAAPSPVVELPSNLNNGSRTRTRVGTCGSRPTGARTRSSCKREGPGTPTSFGLRRRRRCRRPVGRPGSPASGQVRVGARLFSPFRRGRRGDGGPTPSQGAPPFQRSGQDVLRACPCSRGFLLEGGSKPRCSHSTSRHGPTRTSTSSPAPARGVSCPPTAMPWRPRPAQPRLDYARIHD